MIAYGLASALKRRLQKREERDVLMKALISYFSARGSTLTVAEAIAESLRQAGIAARCHATKERVFPEADEILFIGSPTYMFHLAPIVKNYLEALPSRRGGKAVTFSTFGEVCSGGLHAQAARILRRKGYAVVGAIKVPAEHSLMLTSANPLGKGRPSREDLECVRGFTRNLVAAMQNNTLRDIGSPWFAPAHARAIAMMMSVLPHLSVAEKASAPLLPIMKKMIGEASVVGCLS
ncbi:MAG: flavodoxin [bacterium ADurb.Bin431]|nr:MAG: flavodoxin [bacterium ADurb.Bin431]